MASPWAPFDRGASPTNPRSLKPRHLSQVQFSQVRTWGNHQSTQRTVLSKAHLIYQEPDGPAHTVEGIHCCGGSKHEGIGNVVPGLSFTITEENHRQVSVIGLYG